MLKDLPPFDRDSLEAVMNTLPDDQPAPPSNLNDDIFGSAPSSPNLTAQNGTDQESALPSISEHSDIPRLRRLHVTNGYREGVAASKDSHVQAGFDEGFSLGGEIGTTVGWCFGVLEGILAALVRSARESGGSAGSAGRSAVEDAEKMLEQAKKDMKLEEVLGSKWIGEDGIWLFDVPGQDEEEELSVTFKDVAAAHPVLKMWKAKVLGLAHMHGVLLPSGKSLQED
ncbi:hypothetical protein TI39_contig424g00006 [Zymoseptoria brevis]|uniref:Protein YAE1 n=1 Tax=Zymoseptoria brevis TaxID=1047168 RepID=A0A0F4GLH1_9PEZI|nr:hypothetical protein TI39_contig424g00006 [Zymoseptoria brevis]